MFFDLEIINAKTSNDIDRAHRHDFFELFVLEGVGKHLIDFNTYTFSEYTAHIICPKQVHWLNREIETKGFVMKFDRLYLSENKLLKAFYQQVFFNHNFKPVQPISAKVFEIATTLFSDIKKEISVMNHHALVSYITSNLIVGTDNESNNSVFDQFMVLLEENYKEKRNVTEYASEIDVSLKKLNELVKKRTGLSAKQFIKERLFLEAKRMLFHGKLSVKEIAYHLNFNEPAHFSNFFKKESGVYPNEFRKQS